MGLRRQDRTVSGGTTSSRVESFVLAVALPLRCAPFFEEDIGYDVLVAFAQSASFLVVIFDFFKRLTIETVC